MMYSISILAKLNFSFKLVKVPGCLLWAVKRESGVRPERECRCIHLMFIYLLTKVSHWFI